MDGVAFREMVEADPDLRLTRCVEGLTPADTVVEIQFKPYGGGHQLTISEILRAPRDELLALLRSERPGQIMRHINGAERSVGRSAPARSAVPRLLAA